MSNRSPIMMFVSEKQRSLSSQRVIISLTKENLAKLIINGQDLPHESEIKYLDMTLDAKLRWKRHIITKNEEAGTTDGLAVGMKFPAHPREQVCNLQVGAKTHMNIQHLAPALCHRSKLARAVKILILLPPRF